jgi:hypothetical protein
MGWYGMASVIETYRGHPRRMPEVTVWASLGADKGLEFVLDLIAI